MLLLLAVVRVPLYRWVVLCVFRMNETGRP
jgi:hypothetical protein